MCNGESDEKEGKTKSKLLFRVRTLGWLPRTRNVQVGLGRL